MLARNKSQSVVLETSLSEINFCFDKNKIEQVLNNLLGNAMKYSAANTQIQIEVTSTDHWMTTKIVDEGQGIPQDELGKVFHPYQTTSVKATANEKSIGLGLAIVKKIIESHHGEVGVKSEVGKGSVFSFKIPIASC
jgi:two-component system OmpR family sensor kinase